MFIIVLKRMMTSNSKNKIERKINKLYSKSEKLNLKLMMADFNFEKALAKFSKLVKIFCQSHITLKMSFDTR